MFQRYFLFILYLFPIDSLIFFVPQIFHQSVYLLSDKS